MQTNIFFVITSIAVVVVTILVAIILYRVIRILKRLEDITERVRSGTELLADDVSTVRAYVRSGVTNIIGMIAGGIGKRKRTRSKKRTTKKDDVPSDDVGE